MIRRKYECKMGTSQEIRQPIYRFRIYMKPKIYTNMHTNIGSTNCNLHQHVWAIVIVIVVIINARSFILHEVMTMHCSICIYLYDSPSLSVSIINTADDDGSFFGSGCNFSELNAYVQDKNTAG